MDDWVKFKETTLSEKEELYSNLNMEDITHYTCRLHVWKRVCQDFKINLVNIMICILN